MCTYEFKRGEDWFWDYLLFSDNDYEEAEFEMSKEEHDALVVLKNAWETKLKPMPEEFSD